MTEDDFRNSLLERLHTLKSPYKLDKEVPVPYKHIYIQGANQVTLEVWCFKQDIVFFKPLFDINVPYRGATIRHKGQDLVQIKLEKDNAQHTKDVGIPYLIIETKNKQPNTHDILTYTQKAELIKTIFPYCKFVFCIYGSVSPRTYRHGINFDRVVSITNLDDKNQLEEFDRTIRTLLEESEKDLKKLS